MVIPETQEVLSQILQKLEALTLQNAVLQAKVRIVWVYHIV